MTHSPGRATAKAALSLSLATMLGCPLEPPVADEGAVDEADEGDTTTGDTACGDGLVDEDESCDEGALNGTPDHCDHACGFVCEGPCPIRVDIDAPDGGDGTSWEKARNDLRATVEEFAGTGGTVWVAEGIYQPPDEGVVLRVGPGTNLYGGFAGVETTLAQRDLGSHTTTLQQSGTAAVVEIVDFSVDTPPILVDGLEIVGFPDLPVPMRGHGIDTLGDVGDTNLTAQIQLFNLDIHGTSRGLQVMDFTTVEIHASSIHDNISENAGAAIYQDNSRLLVHDSTIVGNQTTGVGQYGVIRHLINPPIDVSYFGYIEMWNSTISDNVGGGIHGATVQLHGCTLEGNSVHRAAANSLSSVYEDCDFVDNLAGAISGSGTIERCRFIDNQADSGAAARGGVVTIRDSLFMGNQATQGGAIHGGVSEFSLSHIDIFDSTFIANSATQGGAIYAHAFWLAGFADVEAFNSQFIANDADAGGALFGPVHAYASSFTGNTANTGPAMDSFVDVFGEDLFPFPGELHSCALWPDEVGTAVAHGISNSCVPAGMQGFFDGGGNVGLIADPFELLDLGDDGFESLYLDPSSPCVDLGGTLDAFDWSLLTTQASHCTDAGPVDAGKHFTPLEDVGACG